MIESAINQMDKYDHRRHELSDWLAELELRFQLGGVDTDQSKINWCQLIIGATGSYILAGLEDEASWETAKEALLSRLGLGSMKDEAWAALKNDKRGPKDTVEIEKLAKRLHPHDGEASERQGNGHVLEYIGTTSGGRGTEIGVPHNGKCGLRRQTYRKSPGRAGGS